MERTDTYAGLTVILRADRNVLDGQDTEGVNVEASINAYWDGLRDDLAARYPGATLQITTTPNTTGNYHLDTYADESYSGPPESDLIPLLHADIQAYWESFRWLVYC